MRLILASGSPRRLELLAHLGWRPEVLVSDVDEVRSPGEAPQSYSRRIAIAKGEAVASGIHAPQTVVLSADTEVVLDDVVFGKPADAADAIRMLRKLSGIEHQVISSVCLIDCAQAVAERTPQVRTQITRVWMRQLSESEIVHYVATGEPMGKAGAYAIQGRAAAFIERIDGSYSSVMGLPLFETAALLAGLTSATDQQHGADDRQPGSK